MINSDFSGGFDLMSACVLLGLTSTNSIFLFKPALAFVVCCNFCFIIIDNGNVATGKFLVGCKKLWLNLCAWQCAPSSQARVTFNVSMQTFVKLDSLLVFLKCYFQQDSPDIFFWNMSLITLQELISKVMCSVRINHCIWHSAETST